MDMSREVQAHMFGIHEAGHLVMADHVGFPIAALKIRLVDDQYTDGVCLGRHRCTSKLVFALVCAAGAAANILDVKLHAPGYNEDEAKATGADDRDEFIRRLTPNPGAGIADAIFELSLVDAFNVFKAPAGNLWLRIKQIGEEISELCLAGRDEVGSGELCEVVERATEAHPGTGRSWGFEP